MRSGVVSLTFVILTIVGIVLMPSRADAQATVVEVHNNTNATLTVYTENVATGIVGGETVDVAPLSIGLVPVPSAGQTRLTFVARLMQSPLIHERSLVVNTGERYAEEVFATDFNVAAMFDDPSFDPPAHASIDSPGQAPVSGRYWFDDGWTGWMVVTQEGDWVEATYGGGRGNWEGPLSGNKVEGDYFWDLDSSSPVTGSVHMQFTQDQVCGTYQRDGSSGGPTEWGCGAREN